VVQVQIREQKKGCGIHRLGLLVGMIGTLTISTVLIFLFGFTRALYGTSISVLSAAVYLVYLFHQETGYSRRRLLRVYVKPVLWIAGLVC